MIYKTENKWLFGYPFTYFVQAAGVVASALYTSHKQGYPLNYPIWRAHYFDWMTFLKRAGLYGVVGGFVLGTIFFGQPGHAIT